MEIDRILDWFQQNYKVITGIVVPIIVAIIGIFKISSLVKKNLSVKGDDNNQICVDGNFDSNNSFNNNSVINSENSPQNIVYGDQIVSTIDIKTIDVMAKGFVSVMFPYADKAFNKLRSSSFEFISQFDSKIRELSQGDLEKFSEVDVQIALRSAINSAAKHDSAEIHSLLARLLLDRVQKPIQSIAKLAINESVEVVSKLDENLIKILSVSFLFSRTKYLNISNIDIFLEKMAFAVKSFCDVDASLSKFEYLEAVSCGKLLQFPSSSLMDNIFNGYRQLFIKNIPPEKIQALGLQSNILNFSFSEQPNGEFKLNPIFGLYLYDGVEIKDSSHNSVSLAESDKLKIKNLCDECRLNSDEIASYLCDKIKGFDSLINIWDSLFSRFSLTAVGIAIGRAYLEQAGFGNFDINVWIK